MRGVFLQVARHREQHRRRDLEHRGGEIFRVFAEIGHQLRDQRQRNGGVAAEHVAHRQVNHRAVRLGAQGRIVADDGVGGGEMMAMGDQRAFRMARGAGGVDDEGRIARREIRDLRLKPFETDVRRSGEQLAKPMQQLVPVTEHRRIVEYDDRFQIGQLIGDRQNLVDIFLVFGDEDRGAAITHLVVDFRRRRGRVDAVDNSPERLRREVADHPFFTDIAHDRDAVAAFDAEPLQGAGGVRHQRSIIVPCSFAVEAEMFGAKGDGIGKCPRPLAQEMRCGAAAQPFSVSRRGRGHWGLFVRVSSDLIL